MFAGFDLLSVERIVGVLQGTAKRREIMCQGVNSNFPLADEPSVKQVRHGRAGFDGLWIGDELLDIVESDS